MEFPPHAEPRPLPLCRSRLPVALKRAAAAVDEAKAKAETDPAHQDEFESAKDEFVRVFAEMRADKRKRHRYAASVNMCDVWGDKERDRSVWSTKQGGDGLCKTIQKN